MRKVLAVMGGLALALGHASPALAQQQQFVLTQATATAHGLELRGLVPLGPLPRVSVSTVPGNQDQTVVDVPVQPVVRSATLRAVAQTTAAPSLSATLPAGSINAVEGGPVPQGGAVWNARAYAVAEDLVAVESVPGGPALVEARLIQAEALVACNGPTPVLAGGSRIVDLKVAGQDLGPTVEGLLNPVLDLAQSLPVIRIIRNEVGRTADGGFFVNALHVIVAEGTPLEQHIVVSHASVSGAVCAAVLAEAPPADIGQQLPRTGGPAGLAPLALGLLATTGGLRLLNLRARRRELQ